MVFDEQIDHISDPSFEEFYLEHCDGLMRYIIKILQNRGNQYTSLPDRAYDIMQESFLTAWAKRQKMFTSSDPKAWLFAVARNKIRETLRAENRWKKRLLLLSVPVEYSDEPLLQLRVQMTNVQAEEDFLLLKRLYVDGYSYSELCAELGISKSALAMRVKRAKEKYEKIFFQM